jgi:LPS export ABC transporter permease LptF
MARGVLKRRRSRFDAGVRMTLTRYVFRQGLAASLMTLAVLVAITLALFLAEMLGDLGQAWLPGSGLFQVLLLRLPEAVVLTAPLALLIGTMMSLGELAVSEEVSVMRAAGVQPGLLGRVLGGLAAIWMIGLAMLVGWAQPWADERSARLADTMAEDWLIRSIQPGRFASLGIDGLTLYVRDVDAGQRSFSGVFLHHSGDGRVELIVAREGRIVPSGEGGRMLELLDGVHIGHAADVPGLPLRRVAFERNSIDLPASTAASEGASMASMSAVELFGAAGAGVQLEWARRLSVPLMCAAMIGFVFPVALSSGRARRMAPVLVAIGAYLAYSNLVQLLLGRAALAERPVDALAAVAGLHALVLSIGLLLFLRWWRRW